MTIQELKQELCLSDKDIAQIFGLKNLGTYQNSSAKVRYETALCRFFEVVKEKINIDEQSEKDLRVCEVNGSYLDGLSSGITACNAEFRVIMQNIYSELDNLPRINKSDMKRALYNHSSCELGEALNPNMHKDSGK